jgi:hypothetical protein
LARTLRYLDDIPCALYDLRTLRIYPSTPLYQDMLNRGKVTPEWWLREETVRSNQILPGCLGVHFNHEHLGTVELQKWALRFTTDLGRMDPATIARVLKTGCRGNGLGFAGLLLSARWRGAKQARMLLRRVEQALPTQGAVVN